MNPVLRRICVALLTASLVVLAILFAPPAIFLPVLSVFAALLILEYAMLLARKLPLLSPRSWPALLLGAAVILVGITSLDFIACRRSNLLMLYIIAIVKIGDMGGFALGLSSARLMKGGNHKLCPTVSPNKSWEGLAGSILAAMALSCLFIPITHFGVGKALAFGLAAALLGTFGDLMESKFKRWVGVKDSATFMPAGLGGFLDMFDSLLIAPFVLAFFL